MTTKGIDLEENKAAYGKKMSRQMKESAAGVKTLLKMAKNRHAEENLVVKRLLEELQLKMETAQEKFRALKNEENEMWPEGSRDVSGAYKELQDLLNLAESKIKPK